MNVFTLGLWEILRWGLNYFDQFICVFGNGFENWHTYFFSGNVFNFVHLKGISPFKMHKIIFFQKT